jgi:hypothetical protein
MVDMTRDEARRQVNRVRDGLQQANQALRALHAGRGWLALEYASFRDMCAGEFGLSEQRAYQKLDHARTVEAMAEALALDLDAATALDVVTEAVPEGLARDIKNVVPDVVQQARRNLAAVPTGAPPHRRHAEQRDAVRRAALDEARTIRPPRQPEQSRRTVTGLPAPRRRTPYAEAVATGRAHAEAVRVLVDGQEQLSDVERLQLLDLRDQIAAAYDRATTAWSGRQATPAPVPDPFNPAAGPH